MRKSFQKPSPAAAVSNVGAKCQKCLKEGHWTADCTNERVYKPRPSRTALLFNPKLKLPEDSLVKDDFIDEKRKNKLELEPIEKEEEEIIEIPDAETFAEQLIEEVKMSHQIKDREISEEGEYKRRDRYRRSRSRSYSHSRSPPRYRSLSRSPHHRTRTNRSRSPEPVRRIEKKYSEYASDSDFSSDSDQ